MLFLKEGIEWKIFSLHHLIGFMGGLQVNRLVLTSQKRKNRLVILPVFFPFFFIYFFSFLINVKKSIFQGRFYHFIGQDFSISNPILLADQYHFHEYSFDVLVISDPFFLQNLLLDFL